MNVKTIELQGQVDQHHRLSAQVPAEVPPGPVKFALLLPAEPDDAEARWGSAVAREWAEDLADTRQDIYTLADGEAVDGTQ